MEVKLISISSSGRRKSFPLTTEVTTVGRQDDCLLRIPLNEISRQHCQFLLGEDGISVKDLGSVNGTFVNGQKVVKRDLNPGDVVSLADALRIMVQIDGQPVEIDGAKLKRTAPAAPEGQGEPKPESPRKAEPAASFTGTSTGATDQDEADQILSESFFLDDEDEDD